MHELAHTSTPVKNKSGQQTTNTMHARELVLMCCFCTIAHWRGKGRLKQGAAVRADRHNKAIVSTDIRWRRSTNAMSAGRDQLASNEMLSAPLLHAGPLPDEAVSIWASMEPALVLFFCDRFDWYIHSHPPLFYASCCCSVCVNRFVTPE